MFGLDLVDAGFAKKYKAEKTDGERIEGGCSPPDLPPKTAQSRKSGTSEKQQKYVWKRSRIDSRDADGRVLDFHCLRVTFVTRLGRAGVPLVQAQKLARHSDPKLTSNVYTRLHRVDEASALAALPRLRIPPRRRAATGTAGPEQEPEPRGRIRGQITRDMAGDSGTNRVKKDAKSHPGRVRTTPFKQGEFALVGGKKGGAREGIRTPGLLIHSQVL